MNLDILKKKINYLRIFERQGSSRLAENTLALGLQFQKRSNHDEA